jgi:hypothetical protein
MFRTVFQGVFEVLSEPLTLQRSEASESSPSSLSGTGGDGVSLLMILKKIG